jgi:hypothetical protein
MGESVRLLILLLLALSLLEVVSSEQFLTSIPVTTVVMKKPYDLMPSQDSFYIKMLPGASDYRRFNLTAYNGNTKTDITLNFTDNVTQLCSFDYYLDTFFTAETHYYKFYIDTAYVDDKGTQDSDDDTVHNFTLGVYNGTLNFTVPASGISNYTNITVHIVNESIGRVRLNITDDAGQPVQDAKITVYFNLSVVERGYTDENGIYYTHFYDYGDYILMSIMKMGYVLKGYSVKVSQPLHTIDAVLKGSSKLEWIPPAIQLDSGLLQSATIQVSLFNTGTALERDISLYFNGTAFQLLSENFVDELPAGQHVNATFFVHPQQELGVYGGYLTADGLRSSASMLLSLLVRTTVDSGGSAPLLTPNASEIAARLIPRPSAQLFIDVDGVVYALQSGFAEETTNLSVPAVMFKAGKSQHYFVTVLNDGALTLRDVRLSAGNDENLTVEILPTKYTELLVNNSKQFILKVLPLHEVEEGSLGLRLSSQNFQTMRTLAFMVINESITPWDLQREITDYYAMIEGLENQVSELKSRGEDMSYAENYLSLISEKLVASEAALDAGDLQLTRVWIDQVASDVEKLLEFLNEFSAVERESSLWILIIWSLFIAGGIAFLVFKKKDKLQSYYVIIKRRFLMWRMLRKVKKR